MGLRKENYSLKGIILSFCLLLFSNAYSQSDCIVRVALEPVKSSEIKLPAKVIQSNFGYYTSWTNPSKSLDKNGESSVINFTKQGLSNILKYSDFGFNIPDGATIHGIKLKLLGRSEGQGNIQDYLIKISNGSNKSGHGYNSKNVWAKGSLNKTFSYGFDDDQWGTNWNSNSINSSNFGVEIQIMNSQSKPIDAYIDYLEIEIFYTPLATYCLTDCFPIYVDPIERAVSYLWNFPSGFEMISKSEQHNVIDFKVMNASAGLHTVCVDAFDEDGNVIDNCCRTIRLRNCTPATLGNFVWNDINYNGIQDTGEPGISNVKVDLYNASNVLIQTKNTDSQGRYTFTNINEGSYYVIVNLPSQYLISKITSTTEDKDNDFISQSQNRSALQLISYGTNSVDLDFGLVKKLMIGDFVWEDLNYNGTQDAVEKGIGAVKVYLKNEAGIIVDSTLTNASGNYLFQNIPADKYSIRFVTTSGFNSTKQNIGASTTDSDVKNNGETVVINFQNTDNNKTIDAGYFRYASIGNFVWEDINKNGLQDSDETGSSGIIIYLYTQNNQLIDSTTTDVNGNYIFDNLFPGSYYLKPVLSVDAFPTLFVAGDLGSDLKDFAGLLRTDLVIINSGDNITNIDLGYQVGKSIISGLVWSDDNNNGQYELSEALQSDKWVYLLNEISTVLDSSKTNVLGEYSFASLPNGSYKIGFRVGNVNQFTDPNIGDDNTDSDILNRIDFGLTDVYSFITSDTISNIFIGISRRSTIGNYIWNDKNYNGLQDLDESGFPGVPINLLDENNNVLQSSLSANDGSYSFNNIITGNYKISIQAPIIYLVTKQNLSDLDSNNDLLINGVTDVFTVDLGVNRLDIDGGLIKNLTIGDFVWEDSNGNGIQDLNENGIENVVINLLDVSGNLIQSTISSNIGQYTFTNIPATLYSFEILIDTLYNATIINQGNSNSDSDINENKTTDLIDFTDVNFDNTIDFGFVRYACIGDLTWIDVNENGVKDNDDVQLDDVLINLFNEAGLLVKISVSDTLGFYKMCGLIPGNYYLEVIPNSAYIPTIPGNGSILIESQILPFYTDTFTIKSGDDLSNFDFGFLFRPKSKICGFVWFDADTDGILSDTELKLPDYEVKLLDGNFMEINRTITNDEGEYCFIDLSPGNYYTQFIINETHQFTLPNIGTDDLDSDAEGLADSAYTSLITIMGSSDQMSVSAGITNRSSIGDFVWFDLNKNGLQGITELGIPGIRIELKNDAGDIINFTTTALGGKYQFDNVVRGNYSLQFASLPSLDFTLKNIDAILGSDANVDGSTDAFAILPNQDNFDLDAGYALKGAGVGGLVWLDLNKDSLRNSGDPLLEGIVVGLYTETNELLFSDTTNFKGEYVFFPVPAGNYYVKFDTLPYLSYQVADALFIESDVTHANGRGSTYTFTLLDGNVLGGVDCGMFDIRSKIEGYTFDDKIGDGVKQPNDSELNDIWVYLIQDSVAIDSVLTDAEGYYLFEEIMPGDYQILFDTIGSNFVFGLKNIGLDSLIDSDVNQFGLTDTFTVQMCQKIEGINAAYRGFGIVSGIMFNDVNENGLNDDNVDGINNVHICILDLNNNILKIDTTKTVNGIAGIYSFANILAGSYKIKVRRPLFYIFTEKDVNTNANDTIDSDVFAIGNFDALSDNFVLESSDTVIIDGGLIFSIPMDSKISGTVWRESTFNGIRENNEALVSDVEMILFSELNVEIKRTTTNIDGNYSFDNLSEGFYYVKAILADSLTTALYHQGNDGTVDNDFFDENVLDATEVFYVGISQNTAHIDLGIAEEISIGDFVWNDENDNGIQDVGELGLELVRVNLRLQTNEIYKSTTTNTSGLYSFSNLPQGNYFLEFKLLDGYSTAKYKVGTSELDSDIKDNGFTDLEPFTIGGNNNTVDAGFVKNGIIGNRIWVDLNSNGIQDIGEPGLNGATLKLYDENNNFIAETSSSITQGGQEGIYQFENIRPGKYYSEITGPEGYVITRYNIGSAFVNSDLKLDGFTELFTLLPGENKEDIDAGFYLPACIGDRVWLDENQNGIQDEGEEGIEGVQVIIFRSNGQPIDTLFTDENGSYTFVGLTQGLYSLKFTINDPYKTTLQDIGEDNVDSDVDSTGATSLISLAHGAKFFDLDAGLYLGNTIHFLISDETFVKEALSNEVSVFPNPALNDIVIKAGEGESIIWIYDFNGSIIDQIKTNQSTVKLSIGGYNAGKYYIKCKTGSIVSHTSFVKFD